MNSNDLRHFGIKGQKWGIRRFQNEDGTLTPSGKKRYTSTGLRASIAKRQNAKIDKSFNKWKVNDERKKTAIELGKKSTLDRIAYEKDPYNKDLKGAYKQSNKDYKKALKSNTTYRKGSVKQEVGKDLSRKYLSEANRVKKQLDLDPSNSALKKQYNQLMSNHAIARSKARRAQEVAANRSRKISNLKRARTLALKGAAVTAAIGAGVVVTNNYLHSQGKQGIRTDDVRRMMAMGKDFLGAAKYF